MISEWGYSHDLNHPWKNSRDPYSIWISEIILQQTRVKQGVPYYHKFLKRFPSVKHLASATEQEVLSLWEGLGYYSRARNLHAAARWIVEENQGKFPKTYKEIIQIKGVGSYTAAAISSFAFDIPVAVLDGNVYRVLSRYFGLAAPTHTTQGRRRFKELAKQNLPDKGHAHYNQAIMDFGAMQCIPLDPDCETCPLSNNCKAWQQGKVELLPLKKPRPRQRVRHFNYLVVQEDKHYYVNKREAKDIWRSLYEFPLIETSSAVELKDLRNSTDWPSWISRDDAKVRSNPKRYSQVLTHQKINAHFWELDVPKTNAGKWINNTNKVHMKELGSLPFPKIIRCYLENN